MTVLSMWWLLTGCAGGLSAPVAADSPAVDGPVEVEAPQAPVHPDAAWGEAPAVRAGGRWQTFRRDALQAQLFVPGAPDAVKLKFSKATADFNQGGWTIAHAVDGNLQTAWVADRLPPGAQLS